ncbi:MAG: hypothetical protein AB7E61_06475 [Acholeplasmataceae bacterium]
MSYAKLKIIEDNYENIISWLVDGWKYSQIYKALDISKATWYKYMKERGMLTAAIAEARQKRMKTVVPQLKEVLLNAALGYTLENAEVVEVDKQDEEGKTVVSVKRTTKKIPPNPDVAERLLEQYTKDLPKKQRYIRDPHNMQLKEKRLDMDRKAAIIKQKNSEWD